MVVTGVLSSIPGMTTVSFLRMFRLLRPLRGLAKLPGLKKLITALLYALPQLLGVVAMLAFTLTVFAVLGLQVRFRNSDLSSSNQCSRVACVLGRVDGVESEGV